MSFFKTILLISMFLLSLSGFSEDSSKTPSRAPARNNPKRGVSLDFDDDVVEGMNRKSLDSLEQLTKKDARGLPHLYRRRTDFKSEMVQNARESGYSP